MLAFLLHMNIDRLERFRNSKGLIPPNFQFQIPTERDAMIYQPLPLAKKCFETEEKKKERKKEKNEHEIKRKGNCTYVLLHSSALPVALFHLDGF